MRWTANLAYAIGLITTDGNLSKDGRHIVLVSKDIEQLENFAKCLNLKNKISTHTSGYNRQGNYHHIQFGNVKLYRFLLKIGLTPNKSKTISSLKVPNKYFFDFLRGVLDGDGHTYSYWDPRWKSSFMLYAGFSSASINHLNWLNNMIENLLGFKGRIRISVRAHQLVFAKKASLRLLKKIYYKDNLICLSRKRFKIREALSIIQQQAGVLKLVNRLP